MEKELYTSEENETNPDFFKGFQEGLKTGEKMYSQNQKRTDKFLAIGFAEWISNKNWFQYLELNGKTYWDNSVSMEKFDKYPTTEELFEIYLKTL
jgi:hypothetical protein